MAERMTNFFTGVREAWSLAKPYFSSEEKWLAWGLLIFVIALNLLNVAMNVMLTYWVGDFYNAIQAYDSAPCMAAALLPRYPHQGLPLRRCSAIPN